MPNLLSLLKFLPYLKPILGAVRTMRPKQQPERSDVAHAELQELRLSMTEQIHTLESELARLNAKYRELQSAMEFTRVLVYLAFGLLVVVFFIATLVLALRH